MFLRDLPQNFSDRKKTLGIQKTKQKKPTMVVKNTIPNKSSIAAHI